jgi:hypothetical protein
MTVGPGTPGGSGERHRSAKDRRRMAETLSSMNTTAIYLQAIGNEEREIAARMCNV